MVFQTGKTGVGSSTSAPCPHWLASRSAPPKMKRCELLSGLVREEWKGRAQVLLVILGVNPVAGQDGAYFAPGQFPSHGRESTLVQVACGAAREDQGGSWDGGESCPPGRHGRVEFVQDLS